ncbi:hypothetical protein AVL56_02735 [Alteromonas stellipolaris]|jgi:signal peptidase|uniref:S24/S26 family peptidase n=1 Tax=Alteromonas stellipolaris TaxID=233316 RepID=UPI0007702A3F|nr:S24/S26 family peptidase [Alteromonas stellipolaris]AMJ93326.1 hypothetical protein AVL56_02735 [Alteromonas stellipolaris]MDP2537467.1 S24/S26 family peptidase [Alteromonas stellipolaris]
MFRLLAIEGNSMQPVLFAGDFILTCKWPTYWLKDGHVVVVHSDKYGVIVKRVVEVCRQRGLLLRGDNAYESVTTEAIGWISPNDIVGKVIYSSPANRLCKR